MSDETEDPNLSEPYVGRAFWEGAGDETKEPNRRTDPWVGPALSKLYGMRGSNPYHLTPTENDISWAGLMELLDEHWPADIFPTLEDDLERDAGARIVSLLRWVDRLKDLVAAQEQATSETEPADECDHTALSRMYRRERNDARAEVERVKNLVCDREDLIIERDATLARVEAVCATAIRVRTERMVEGSLVHIAAKDAIDTFAEAVRDAMLDTARPFHAQHGQNVQITYTNPDSSESGAKAAIQNFIARGRFKR